MARMKPDWRPTDRAIQATRSRAAIGAIAVLLVAAVIAPASTRAADPGANEWIVFASAVGDSFDTSIWVMDADGSDRSALTSPATAADRSPRWSPDGSRIAFSRRDDGSAAETVWVMDADGSHETELGPGRGPAWSRGGSRIAFVKITDAVFDRDVWVMDADGSDRTQVTDGDQAFAVDWAPDGTRIAYGDDALGGYNGVLRTVRPDGSDDRQLKVTVAAPRPAYSPDVAPHRVCRVGRGSVEIVSVPRPVGRSRSHGPHTGLPADLGEPTFAGRPLDRVHGLPESRRGDSIAWPQTGREARSTSRRRRARTRRRPIGIPPRYPFGDIATSPLCATSYGCTTRG